MKLRVAALAALLCLTTPAFAAGQCIYTTPEGDLAITKPGDVTIVHRNGGETVCPVRGAGTGMTVGIANCAGVDYPYFAAPSKLDGKEVDLLILMNAVWYLTSCGEDAPA